MAAIKDDSFPIGEARKIVANLFKPKPWIYWTDFLVTLVITYSCILFLFYQENLLHFFGVAGGLFYVMWLRALDCTGWLISSMKWPT